jgi:hypothetical protein
MTLSNQCLSIQPDHALAQKFYDAVDLSFALILERHPVYCSGDVARLEIIDRDLKVVGDAITEIQNEIRRERGGDATCTVGLTYDRKGYPVVNGRPGGPPLSLVSRPGTFYRRITRRK